MQQNGNGIMDNKISGKQYILVASMLFGMFFGAGNLIFPIILGAKAGASLVPALIGLIITAVGMPLLGVVALGVSRSSGLMEMSSQVSRGYGYFFTCALSLTIGPFFAIPRCAATSFTMGIEPLLSEGTTIMVPQLIFTTLYFAAVLFFSLRPAKILDSIGKFLNPIFLVCLGVLLIAALIDPVQSISSVPVDESYAGSSFATGFLQGYDTLDALASLLFGIVVIDVITGMGVKEPGNVAKSTIKSGAIAMTIMAIIYILIAIVGAQSYGLYADRLGDADFNGGTAFSIIAEHYLGKPGMILLAVIVTFCTMKTAIGLITSCSDTFAKLFPNFVGYKAWAIFFTLFSLVVANFGLSKIISLAAPVLYFLYPLAIVLILLCIFGKFFGNARPVYVWGIGLTMIAAILDLFRVSGMAAVQGIVDMAGQYLPFYTLGLGWIVPGVLGTIIGLVIAKAGKKS